MSQSSLCTLLYEYYCLFGIFINDKFLFEMFELVLSILLFKISVLKFSIYSIILI